MAHENEEIAQQTERTIPDLLAENASLQEKNAHLEKMTVNLLEQTNELGEFIRQRMSDILALVKQFRDEYTQYAHFVGQITAESHTQTGDLDDQGKEEVPVQLVQPES